MELALQVINGGYVGQMNLQIPKMYLHLLTNIELQLILIISVHRVLEEYGR